MRWNQGERRGIITQMQLLSTRKEDGHQPLSTATRQQGNERKVHKGNVYGTVRTPGMLAEIRRAEELNIPVKADQPGLKKKKDRPRRGQIR